MLSGRSERELVMECIDAGASGYILKDMESDGVFRRALDTVFQGSIFLPTSVLGRGGFHTNITGRPISGLPGEPWAKRQSDGSALLPVPGNAQQDHRQQDGNRGVKRFERIMFLNFSSGSVSRAELS